VVDSIERVFHVLDNPVWESLTGPHAQFAERRGRVARYRADISPFAAFESEPSTGDWRDLAELAGPAAGLGVMGMPAAPPAGWEHQLIGPGVQMVAEGPLPPPLAGEVRPVRLGDDDVPEMLDLVARTKPGPFLPRTIELGAYLGIRVDRQLVAMAGERLHPPGWTEISAVCTDPSWRGHGFARQLTLAEQIRARGENPFLHAVAANPAVALYEKLGFRHRGSTSFTLLRTPVAG
jgi:ribosomal protein S18 acetylase RimI-like enzyme